MWRYDVSRTLPCDLGGGLLMITTTQAPATFRSGPRTGRGDCGVEAAEVLDRGEGAAGPAPLAAAPPTPARPAHRQQRGDQRERQPRQNLHPATFMRPAYGSVSADPLAATVDEVLVFPNRDLGLEVVDQPPARGEGDVPVRRRHRDDHGGVTDLQVPGPVDGGQRGHGGVVTDTLRNLPQVLQRVGMRLVGQLVDRLLVVVVAHSADEDRGSTRRRVSNSSQHLVARQRALPYVQQPDRVAHPSLIPAGPPGSLAHHPIPRRAILPPEASLHTSPPLLACISAY